LEPGGHATVEITAAGNWFPAALVFLLVNINNPLEQFFPNNLALTTLVVKLQIS